MKSKALIVLVSFLLSFSIGLVYQCEKTPVEPEDQHQQKVLAVPYYDQGNTEWCVPASMAMIFKYYGDNIHQWDIAQDWGISRDGPFWDFGDQKDKVFDYFNNRGLIANEIDKDPAIIEEYIDQSKPVFLSISGISTPIYEKAGHTIVIVGYDYSDGNHQFYINDPGMVFTNTTSVMPSLVKWEDINGDWYTKEYATVFSGKDPSPPNGSLDLGASDGPLWNGGLYFFYEEEFPHPQLYGWMYGLDKGLAWKSREEHPLALTGQDQFQFGGAITNHTSQSQTYQLQIKFASENYSPDAKTYTIAVDARSSTGSPNAPIVSEPVALSEYLNDQAGEYTITLSLYDAAGQTLYDRIQFPPISYSETGSGATSTWTRTFGGQDHDGANSVQQTTDGGYILAGWTSSYGAGVSDAWLIKTDALGNKEWDQTFGGSEGDGAYSVQQTNDGGYILAGYTRSFGAGYPDAWLIKTDAEGNKLWDQIFGGWLYREAYSVQQTTDGGYILAGYVGYVGGDAWLIKTDADGQKIWDQTFDGATYGDRDYSVQQTTDGGYILAGWTVSWYTNGYEMWLIKTNAQGQKLWDQSFGGSKDDKAHSVQQTTDGGYIVAGHTKSFGAGGYDAWLIRTDAKGQIEWESQIEWACSFGGSDNDYAKSVQQTTDGGYILAGYTESYGELARAMLG